MARWITAALIAATLGCAGRRTDEDSVFQGRLLGTIPEDARVVVPVDFSADGRRAAWVMRRGETCRAVCGAWVGIPYGVVC